jgi:VanZ family protein
LEPRTSDPGTDTVHRIWLWGPPIAQTAVIFVASSISDLGPLPGGVSDKSGHSFGYAILGVLLLRALAGGRLSGVTWRRALVAIALSTLYGLSDEFHQRFVPGRSPELLDLVADAVGASAAVALGCAAAAAVRAWGILRSSP